MLTNWKYYDCMFKHFYKRWLEETDAIKKQQCWEMVEYYKLLMEKEDKSN